jgi:hypothetical protein
METFSIDEILNELPPPEKESPKNKFYNGRSSANGGASIVDLFNQSGRYLNPLPNCPGGHAVTCLWSDLHSNAQMPGDTSTAIFEAEGEKPPGFKCMHSHCADRNIKDVYKFFGYGGDHHWSREKNSAAKENADTNSSFNETDQVWEKIIPIDEFEVRPLDQSLFPDPLNRFIEAVSRSSETPPELAAMMALGAVSLSVTGKYEIETVNGHAEPLNLYLLCALESGNRKTSVLNLCKAPLEVWEAAKGNEFSSAIKEATAKKKNEEAKIKKLRASLGERKPIEDQITEREIIKLESELTEIPVRPRLIANDVTPERLASLLFEQGERMVTDSSLLTHPFLRVDPPEVVV